MDCLLGGYLHEDWQETYHDAWLAVEGFVHFEDDYAPLVRNEITEVLDQFQSEADLHRRLLRLGLGYHPPADGWTSYRDWLLAVADRVDEILRTTREHPTAV